MTGPPTFFSGKAHSFYPPGEDPRLPQNQNQGRAGRAEELAMMNGITISAPGSPFEKSDRIPRPKPAKGQVLVKSLWTGINPVYVAIFLVLSSLFPFFLRSFVSPSLPPFLPLLLYFCRSFFCSRPRHIMYHVLDTSSLVDVMGSLR
jgi:hypothetical protein